MPKLTGFARTSHWRSRAGLTVALLAALFLGLPRGEAEERSAQEIVDRMMAVLGGRETITALRSLAVEADCSGPGGEFRTRVESLRPDAVYFHQSDGEGSTEIWSTAARTWTRDAESGFEELDDGFRDFVRGHEFHLLVLELETRFSGHRLNDSALDVGCRRIDMEDLAGHAASVCLRESDGLPVSLEMNPPGAQGPILVRFEDWREIDGIRYFHTFVLTEGTQRTFTYRYRAIEPNGVAANRFVVPATRGPRHTTLPAAAAGFVQTSADAYTRYELLSPDSESFRIIYDVTATTSGARHYFNPVRQGSEPTVHGVTDLASGEALAWRLVSSEAAAAAGLAEAGHEGEFLQVTLARPVPDGGEGRIRIDKTYKDGASYHGADGSLVFERTLGVKRNAVVLPIGYELTGCNYPSQVATEADGRIRVSFLNRGPAGVPFRLEARARPMHDGGPVSATAGDGQIEDREAVTRLAPTSARTDFDFAERAFQDREIVYFLQQPETHSFRLYHDYTETRAGVDRYLNVVRPGSRASEPSASVLDTGERLKVETLRGANITRREIDIGEEVTPETEVVVIWFEPVAEGTSTRLRIEETYTDPGRYGLDGEELLWDRAFGRARNTVVLPAGWYLTASSVPAVINETESGEIRLYFENDRPGVIEVFIRARRR